MTNVNTQLPFADIEEDSYPSIPILFVPPRMLTRTRVVPLLAINGEISMRIVMDSTEPSIAIGIPEDIFAAITDSELLEVINLFRGLVGDAYHPRLLAILKRSLN